jgi:flagellar operon protein
MRIGVLQSQTHIHELQSRPIKDSSNPSMNIEQLNPDFDTKSFQNILDKKILEDNSIRFSENAFKQLETIHGPLSNEQMKRLENGLEKLKNEHVSSGLLMMDSIAFVMNVKNQTIISSVSESKLQNNVFSNLDALSVV